MLPTGILVLSKIFFMIQSILPSDFYSHDRHHFTQYSYNTLSDESFYPKKKKDRINILSLTRHFFFLWLQVKESPSGLGPLTIKSHHQGSISSQNWKIKWTKSSPRWNTSIKMRRSRVFCCPNIWWLYDCNFHLCLAEFWQRAGLLSLLLLSQQDDFVMAGDVGQLLQ